MTNQPFQNNENPEAQENNLKETQELSDGLRAIIIEKLTNSGALEVEYYPQASASKEVWEQRYKQVCDVFGVEIKREVVMPTDLITEKTSTFAEEGTGVPYQGPKFPTENWPKDGYLVVRTPSHIYCFGNGPTISFRVEDEGIRFGGYYDRFGPKGLADSLYQDFTEHDRTKIEQLASRLGLSVDDLKARYQKDRNADGVSSQ